jgi:betaine-homocysteine S-methyltransferase
MSEDRLTARLKAGPVICAEGYLFELERRGYLQAGHFVPEAVLEHPEEVSALHRHLVHAGSDVVEALTYYGHREKLRLIGKGGRLEELNRRALGLAREVAEETDTLLAGNVCNTNVYNPDDADTVTRARRVFTEQAWWAAEEGADLVIAETFRYCGEALLALEAVREVGLPAVITLAVNAEGGTREGWPLADAYRRLEDGGAAVVGVNCLRGPATMLPLLAELVEAVSVPTAALPAPYRTTEAEPTYHALRDPGSPLAAAGPAFPSALDPFVCTREEIAAFTRLAHDAGVRYLGLCCGASPHHVRAMAEALGRTPEASRYSPDMSKHAFFGTDPALARHNPDYSAHM